MKLLEFLLCATAISTGVVNAKATPVSPNNSSMVIGGPVVSTNASTPLPPAPSPVIEDDKVLSEAYYNTLGILSEDNSCSSFFGGKAAAVMVFNRFMAQVRKDYLSRSIGMRMSGGVTVGLNMPTNTKYRMFDKVSINANGPFYRKKFSPSEASVPRLGRYEPNTKEVRVLILLHELGHLMKGDDGNWLLPDDGKAESLSHDNSQKIEDVCGNQISSLAKAGVK